MLALKMLHYLKYSVLNAQKQFCNISNLFTERATPIYTFFYQGRGCMSERGRVGPECTPLLLPLEKSLEKKSSDETANPKKNMTSVLFPQGDISMH